MRSALIRAARVVGFLVALACAAFVAWRWHDHGGALGASFDLANIAAAAALYALCGVPLALGWIAALRLAGDRSVPARAAAVGYLATQIAKYLPGGVFQFVSRHLHGRRYGATHAQLAAASVIETLSLLVAASATMLAFGEALAASGLPWLDHLRYAPLALTALAAAVWAWSGRAPDAARQRRALPVLLLASLGAHVAFFAGGAAVCAIVAAQTPLGYAQLLPAFAAAWIAGYVVIGAPGGIGVREAVLVLLLKPSIGEPAAIDIAIGFRIATVAGDALMALAAATISALDRRHSPAP
ncbi:hypothetical protein [Tahibacter soli]|uniref:Lysylphosphatidylglycerol synthase-like protein n=1 Tax=Tahibacter soli TaxID=2983605 RepID=A0A9X3YPZ0_9GAMM|nr:hypothetical protein [Tahibacter soli]MDC8015829.1 hypothetical protein [Tahibacter soli]